MTIRITGLGVVTALGTNVGATWKRVCDGDRGFAPISLFSGEGQRATLVGEVSGVRTPDIDGASRTGELALLAVGEAITDAKLDVRRRRVGLVIGGTTAGMFETESLLAVLLSPEGAVDPEHRKEALSRMLSHPLSAPTDRIARVLGPFARVRSLSSACSSGANALIVGATWLELGLVDAVVCGAADSLCRVTLSGFNALAALDRDGARPFDIARRGLTLGEGAGFVVLEKAGSDVVRGRATLLGWAARSEAHHITNPEPSGEAPVRAMRAALERAGLTPADVDYVNAHGTGTPLNDPMESRALARVFGEHVKRVRVSSQKGQIGHTLAAAGAIEAVLTTLAIERGTVPPTGGLENPDSECPLVHVFKAEKYKVKVAISSSFGFGGMDTVLVFGRADHEAPTRPNPRTVVITGIGAVTPAGIAAGTDVATLAEKTATTSTVEIEPSLLDAERARRLDRASRLAAIACGRALGNVQDAGIVLGSAFGAVDATSAFMRRLQTKGPRLASPADFPSLVPSSPAGHVSIYQRLEGPAFVVADLAISGEAALVQAVELVAAGDADRMCAVAVEERSTIVEQVLSIAFGGSGENRREGASAIAIAAEGTPGVTALARLGPIVAWTNEGDAKARLAELGSPPDGAVVVLGAKQPLLDATAWAKARRVECDALGTHEAAGGIALAIAAALVARGDAPAALFMGTARGSGYAGTILPPTP